MHPDSTREDRAADSLELDWKVKPLLYIEEVETLTLMEVDGPGTIQHIWMVAG